MRREAERLALGTIEPVAGQREELPHPPRQPRQIPAAADIGEQPDSRLGHREFGVSGRDAEFRSEEHTSELQSLMRTSYAVFCLNKKKPLTKVRLTSHDMLHITQHISDT